MKCYIWAFFFLSKMCEEISSVIKIRQEQIENVFTFVTISGWIGIRMRNVSHKSCRENQNTYFMFNNFSRKLCHLWDNVEKCGEARETPDSMAHARVMLDKQGYMRANTHRNVQYLILFHCNCDFMSTSLLRHTNITFVLWCYRARDTVLQVRA